MNECFQLYFYLTAADASHQLFKHNFVDSAADSRCRCDKNRAQSCALGCYYSGVTSIGMNSACH